LDWSCGRLSCLPVSCASLGDPGCSIHDGGGEPLGALAARPRGRSRRTFAPRGSAHGTHIVIVSTILGATDDGLATPLRTRRSRRAVILGARTPGRLALHGAGIDGCGVARCLPSLGRVEGYRTSRVPEGRARSGGQRGGTGGNALRPARARIGRSRSCSRVVVRCRSRQTVSWRRQAGALHFTRSGSVRRRSPSSQPHRTRVRGGE